MLETFVKQALYDRPDDSKYKQAESFLSLCKNDTDLFKTKNCLNSQSLRFGFKKLPDFDPLYKLPYSLAVFIKGEAGASCNAEKNYHDEDIFVRIRAGWVFAKVTINYSQCCKIKDKYFLSIKVCNIIVAICLRPPKEHCFSQAISKKK